MMSVKLAVIGQQLKRLTTPYLVRDSKNYIQLDFKFMTKDWAECKKTAIFNGKYKEELTSDAVIVPASCLTESKFTVSVFGEVNDMLITTNELTIEQGASGYVGNAQPLPDAQIEELKKQVAELQNENDVLQLANETLSADNAIKSGLIDSVGGADLLGWVEENLVSESQPKNAIFCGNKNIVVIPEFFDLSNLENAENLFNGCVNLTTILPVIDFSKITDARGLQGAFENCLLLEHARFVEESIRTNFDILSPKLTAETVLSIQNGLCDAYSVVGNELLLGLSSETLEIVPDDFWDITATKGWSIQ